MRLLFKSMACTFCMSSNAISLSRQHVAQAVDSLSMHQLDCNRWGQHMHHGYYEPGKQVGNQQAQIDMIERTLDWAGVTAVKNVRVLSLACNACHAHVRQRRG